jgi:glyoxylase-like metal-dependent hydrolase (beta-lactamase superfamily II)
MHKLPYQLTDKLFVLGQDLFLTYLVLGNPCTLLDLGVSASVPLIEEQLRELGVKNEDIGHLVVLHAHWDHVCGLPYMQRIFPNATVWGSAKAQDVLNKSKIVDNFRRNDEKYCTRLKELGEFKELAPFLDYNTMTVERTIEDEETVIMGGIEMKFLATLGHSPCTLSVFIPSEKATIISDAIGCYDPITDEYLALFFQSVKMTLDSLERLKNLDANIVAYCHDTEMIFFGREEIENSFQRIKEELLKLRKDVQYMETAGVSAEDVLDKLFRASYRGFLSRMYPPEYIRAVAPLLQRAINK